ncbi:MAG: secretin N-terminal domain-containing protein [Luteolibacter sp.]
MRSLLILLIPFLVTALPGQDAEIPAIREIPQPAPAVPVDVAVVPDDLGTTIIQEPIELPKLSGNDLAALYRKYTGRRVIVASQAALAEFSFIQPASKEDPLTYAEAATLLRKAATIENFVFVPDASDPNLDILTLATAGLKPTGRGVEVYTESDILPEGDAVISYVMSLNYIKPDEAVRTFTQIIGQFGAFGSIAAVPNAASVVITENTSLIRKLIDLKEQIDKPSSQIASRFISVRYADVTELATILNEVLGNQDTSRTAGVQRTQRQNNANNNQQGALTQEASASGEETPVQLIPDGRTNRIFALGRPVDLLFVEGLIREFDVESDNRNSFRRKLKFLSVSDFLPIAADALTRAFSGTGESGQTQGGGNNNNQQSNNQNNNRQQGNAQGGGNAGSGADALSSPDVNSAPESLLVGRTQLVADNITNSIVVQGPPSSVEIIVQLLDQIDVKADQVMISTVFGQLSLNNSSSTGIDWIRNFGGSDEGGAAGSLITGGAVNSLNPINLINPIVGTDPSTFASQTGLSLYGKIGNNLAAYVNLLASSSDFTLLSRPSVFASNNQRAVISSGRRIAIPTSSNNFSDGGVSTNIEYRDVVLKLEVIPLVNSEDEITVTVALLSDDVIGQSEPIGDIGSVPIIGTRELLTTITVPNNQTIVLGGLITSNDTESVTGIPVLSDIPGLGRLFSTKTKGVDRSELMIFIQPSIVNSQRSLDSVQEDADSRYSVGQKARTFSEGNGVLPPRLDNAKENIPEALPVPEKKRKSLRIGPMNRR